MRASLTLIFTLAAGSSAAFGQSAHVRLTSPQSGQTVQPGATINWTISVDVSTNANVGLALVSTDLVHDPLNPQKFNIPPGSVGSIGATMAQFSRPAGISNPGEGGPTTGYIGVQRGASGEKHLVQIGGSQNTYGVAGGSIGQDINVQGGIGQSGLQTVVTGSFAAPSTPGVYVFRLANAMVNVLTAVNAPPNYSPVVAATVDAVTFGSITFTIAPSMGDMNCDSNFNTADVPAFVQALVDPAAYGIAHPGCDPLQGDFADNNLLDGDDINGFVDALIGP